MRNTLFENAPMYNNQNIIKNPYVEKKNESYNKKERLQVLASQIRSQKYTFYMKITSH